MAHKNYYVVWKSGTTIIYDDRREYEHATKYLTAPSEAFIDPAEAIKAYKMTYEEWEKYKEKTKIVYPPLFWE